MVESESAFRPKEAKYLSAKALELLPTFYGERGTFVVGFYTYARWVDNLVDESDLSKEQKLTFLKRQIDLLDGVSPEEPEPLEQKLLSLPWNAVPQEEIRRQAKIMMHALIDDVNHQGFIPRTEREVRHNNWRAILPCFEGISLAINGRPLRVSSDFAFLVDNFNQVAALQDLEENLDIGLINLPLPGDFVDHIGNLTEEERKVVVRGLFHRRRFQNEKADVFRKLGKYSPSVLTLDMPLWQKLIFFAYIWEVIVKRSITASYPSSLRPTLPRDPEV